MLSLSTSCTPASNGAESRQMCSHLEQLAERSEGGKAR